ncbi:MAG: methylenetetrahydrofolate reductase [Rubrobacteraceae bacterium]
MIQEVDSRGALVEALQAPRYEVIPLKGIEEQVFEHVPGEVKLTVTASPSKGLDPTLRVAGLLSQQGYRAVPHLSARLVSDERHLEEILHQLSETGIREAFVVAGDRDEPVGKFAGAKDLLRAMAEIGHGLEEVGITGYPESHPLISDDATIQAMHEKAPYATYVVSQMCFTPQVIVNWIHHIRDRGVGLPVEIGMPGSVDRLKLLRISGSIGLGESARFLKKHHNRLLRLFLPGGYDPDHLVEGVMPTLADPQSKIRGFHIYTFNEVDKTEAWRRHELDRLGAKA